MINVEGGSCFRHILVASLLSRRSVSITGIHPHPDVNGTIGINPEHEANFLKFIQRVTTGTKMEVRQQNTVLNFIPGMILGGTFEHEVPAGRCVTYCIEAAILLLPFAKYDSKIRFIGSTHSDSSTNADLAADLSVDTLRVVTCRIMALFGVSMSIRIIRRGCEPLGNGCVEVIVNHVKQSVKSVKLLERGKIKRIRGISFACRVAPDLPQRTATAAKGMLLNILPDVYVVSDLDNKSKSSGYGCILVAETTSKTAVISQETVASAKEQAEDVGVRAAHLLLEQVAEGGCVDAHHQMLTLMLMGVGPQEASSIRFGPLTPGAISVLTLLEQFFGVTCAIKNDDSDVEGFPSTTVITCLGCNLVNVARKGG